VRRIPAAEVLLLEMFPYPSGGPHGPRAVYAIGDLLALTKGCALNVLIPWLVRLRPARRVTRHRSTAAAGHLDARETSDMALQLKKMASPTTGPRKVAPAIVVLTMGQQVIFLKMLERGLAYRKRFSVNWCPSCQTGLATSRWRPAVLALRLRGRVREIEGWFFKSPTTRGIAGVVRPAARLARTRDDDAAQLDRKKRGCRVRSCRWPAPAAQDPVFTTRPDTAFGMTYAVLAPDTRWSIRSWPTIRAGAA